VRKREAWGRYGCSLLGAMSAVWRSRVHPNELRGLCISTSIILCTVAISRPLWTALSALWFDVSKAAFVVSRTDCDSDCNSERTREIVSKSGKELVVADSSKRHLLDIRLPSCAERLVTSHWYIKCVARIGKHLKARTIHLTAGSCFSAAKIRVVLLHLGPQSVLRGLRGRVPRLHRSLERRLREIS